MSVLGAENEWCGIVVIEECLEIRGIRWCRDGRWLISLVWGVFLEKERGFKLC